MQTGYHGYHRPANYPGTRAILAGIDGSCHTIHTFQRLNLTDGFIGVPRVIYRESIRCFDLELGSHSTSSPQGRVLVVKALTNDDSDCGIIVFLTCPAS